jgi:hypothetical protein
MASHDRVKATFAFEGAASGARALTDASVAVERNGREARAFAVRLAADHRGAIVAVTLLTQVPRRDSMPTPNAARDVPIAAEGRIDGCTPKRFGERWGWRLGLGGCPTHVADGAAVRVADCEFAA